MKISRFVIFAIGMVLAESGCRVQGADGTPDSRTLEKEGVSSLSVVDSATAVKLAIDVFRREGYDEPLQVIKFDREPNAFLIKLVPVPPTDPMIGNGGGGGVVSVSFQGVVKLIEGFQ